jgi:hypothetical protein
MFISNSMKIEKMQLKKLLFDSNNFFLYARKPFHIIY